MAGGQARAPAECHHLLEHRRVVGAERHGHAFILAELLDRLVLDGDPAGGLIYLHHLAVGHRTDLAEAQNQTKSHRASTTPEFSRRRWKVRTSSSAGQLE